MADVRKRQTPNGAGKSQSDRPSKVPSQSPSTGLPINAILALVSIVAAGLLYYSGAFSGSPTAQEVADPGHSATSASPSPVQASNTKHTDLTDAELRAYDGTDPDKPVYLAINGTIFDVSVGRAFYGPGGHYGHFAGRDATRAWVTECWDTEDQLTHDMRGIEEMYMPKYMDEELTDAANGKTDQPDALREQAAQVIKKFGKVGKKERARRRDADLPEAKEAIERALAHWVNFFASSEKYARVGKVVREEGWEESAPAPPAICDEARKKKPIRGGKMDSFMNKNMMMGGADGRGMVREGDEGVRIGEMPDFVKEKLAKNGMEA